MARGIRTAVDGRRGLPAATLVASLRIRPPERAPRPAGSIGGGFLAQRIARRTGRVRALLLVGTVQTSSLVLIGTVRHLGALVAGAYGLNGPALLAAALSGLAVTSLIPVRRPDVPVVAPLDSATAGRVPR